MVNVEDLVRYLHDTVPITAHMQVRAVHGQAGEVALEAPLAPNVNDKGTAFGGTLATLVTLAGWAMTRIIAQDASSAVDVVVVSGNITYRSPVRGPSLVARCYPPVESQRESFLGKLELIGRARIELDVEITENGVRCVQYRGGYVATIGEAQHS